MKLLIAVINETDRVEEILAGFLRIGITGATVLASEGMGRVLSQDDPPAFAGLQSLVSSTRPQNTTLFSVVPDAATADRALELLEDLCGPFEGPATGIAMILPVDRALGVVDRSAGNA